MDLDSVEMAPELGNPAALYERQLRDAAGSDHLADLVRRDQDLAREAERQDKAIIAAVSREGTKRDASACRRDFRRARHLNLKNFAGEFPDDGELSNPLPMTARQVQALLSDDEALLLFAIAEQGSYVFGRRGRV